MELLTLTLPGKPPTISYVACNQNTIKAAEAVALVDLARKTAKSPPTTESISVSIRCIRKNGDNTPVEVIAGVVDALQGTVYENATQLCEVFYTERRGQKEHYNISISLPEFQIPALLEPVGELGYINANPSKFFPDDKATRWMLGLLLASEDIGLTMKLFTPYIMSPTVGEEPHRQYRTSHMLYFWRLWLAHIHEAWCAFNKNGDSLVAKVKENSEVKTAVRKIGELRGRKMSGTNTAGDFMEKCRHTVFHYGEEDCDAWGERLSKLSPDFNVCITHGELKAVDSRWLVADEYLLSRLSVSGLGDRELNESTRELALEVMNLVKQCQQAYFNEREPGFTEG